CSAGKGFNAGRSGNSRHGAIQVAGESYLWEVQGLGGFYWTQSNANRFSGGLIALGGNATDRNQNVGLRIVRGGAASGNRVGDDRKTAGLAHLSFKVTVYVYDLACLEIFCFHIKRVQEERPASIK